MITTNNSLYSFFLVIPRRLNFICRVSEHCSISIGLVHTTEQCSETTAQNSDAGESPKRKNTVFTTRRKLKSGTNNS